MESFQFSQNQATTKLAMISKSQNKTKQKKPCCEINLSYFLIESFHSVPIICYGYKIQSFLFCI